MKYHQKRYENVLNFLGSQKVEELIQHINPPKFGIYRCRVIYTTDTIDVSYHEYKKKEVSSLKVLFHDDINYSMKSTYRDEIDALYAQRGKCDDILIVKDLLVCDTSIANIAFYKDGEWITPKNPLLKGTTRARLLDEGKIVEADIKVQDIRNFSKIALLNAMIDFYVLEKCEFLI